jgi:hypothetical protein
MGHQQYRTLSDNNCNRQYSTPIQMGIMRGCSAPMSNGKVSDNIFNFQNVNDSQNVCDGQNVIVTPHSHRGYASPMNIY